MGQLRLPGTTPSYVRLELHWEGELGWTVRHFEGDSPRYISAKESSSYSFLTGPEAADIVAAILDGALVEEAPLQD